MNAYKEELYESEHICTATKGFCITLDTKCEKTDLHKVMEGYGNSISTSDNNTM